MPPPPAHQTVPRLLGVDPGSKRTGLAVSDELGMFAHPRPALQLASLERLAAAITAFVAQEGIGEVVLGVPVSMSGGDSSQAKRSRQLAALLRARLAIPVTEWDERLSSIEAARRVPGARSRTGELDSEAACIILQAVLDARRLAAAR